jgi:hypothetical protein
VQQTRILTIIYENQKVQDSRNLESDFQVIGPPPRQITLAAAISGSPIMGHHIIPRLCPQIWQTNAQGNK